MPPKAPKSKTWHYYKVDLTYSVTLWLENQGPAVALATQKLQDAIRAHRAELAARVVEVKRG